MSKKMKVFRFARNGESYTIASETKQEAKQHLQDEHGVNIPNCFEIPEADWDKKDIAMHVDNDVEKEKFYTSIREQMLKSGLKFMTPEDKKKCGI